MAATPATNLTLVSSGLADARLLAPKGNPDPAQFLSILYKTTRWAAQWSRVDFDGAPEFGTRISMTLPRRGELISAYTLVVTLPDLYTPQLAAVIAASGTTLDAPGAFLGPVYGWTNALGHALVERIELEIGGAVVDTLDGRLLEILDELGEPLGAVACKNRMICRAISGFGPRTWLSSGPLTLRIPIPFWFSQRGSLAAALPLDALSADAVRIHVTFRGVESLYYTEGRVDARTADFRAGTDVEGGMWGLQGGRFWMRDPASSGRVYSVVAGMPAGGVSGRLIDGVGMPARLGLVDAHAIVEYISLEEREAIAMRSAELTYLVRQHVAIPVVSTERRSSVLVPLPYANPVSDMFWVAQRPEALTYNAWFLFTRDLSRVGTPQTPLDICRVPWWPDGSLALTAESRWAVRPAFQECFSEPLESATLDYGTYERFAHGGGSLFRALVPAAHYTKSAIHDRYVYAYSFSVGATESKDLPTGMANWDKLKSKELVLTMATGRKGALPPDMRVYVYLRGWNVFKVFGGRGGLLFAG